MIVEELLSVKELSKRWKVHRRTVRRLLDEGGVQPVFLSRRRKGTIRYRAHDVDRFVEESIAMQKEDYGR